MSEGDLFREHIAKAVDRAKTCQNPEELYRMPGLKMYRYGDNTVSWYRKGDVVHVVHVYGVWDTDAAQALGQCLRDDMEAWGVRRVGWIGRPGWRRFLKQKGVI